MPDTSVISNSFRFVGWGKSANPYHNGKYGSKRLNDITITKNQDSRCRAIYRNQFNAGDICAGTCVTSVGDGGGPLIETLYGGRPVFSKFDLKMTADLIIKLTIQSNDFYCSTTDTF